MSNTGGVTPVEAGIVFIIATALTVITEGVLTAVSPAPFTGTPMDPTVPSGLGNWWLVYMMLSIVVKVIR
jgi:hypothetical protein